MAKRSFNFKNIKHSNILDREALKREITQKRDALKLTLTEKRDALKRGPDSIPGRGVALTRTHKVAVAGVATLGAAAIAVSLVPNDSNGSDHQSPAAYTISSQDKDVQQSAGKKATAEKSGAAEKHDTATKAKTDASKAHKVKQSANRSDARKPVYANNLDGWIRESLAIMKKHDIPGSYDGLYRNIIRESSGNPAAINNWDINAQNGIPSKGLLQVIPPTFQTYHVSGTSWNIYDPVANITAAANYAADRYGSMDNVNSAY
jgi:hypothetical protein